MDGTLNDEGTEFREGCSRSRVVKELYKSEILKRRNEISKSKKNTGGRLKPDHANTKVHSKNTLPRRHGSRKPLFADSSIMDDAEITIGQMKANCRKRPRTKDVVCRSTPEPVDHVTENLVQENREAARVGQEASVGVVPVNMVAAASSTSMGAVAASSTGVGTVAPSVGAQEAIEAQSAPSGASTKDHSGKKHKQGRFHLLEMRKTFGNLHSLFSLVRNSSHRGEGTPQEGNVQGIAPSGLPSRGRCPTVPKGGLMGEVWAIYKEWSKKWCSDAVNKRSYECEIVEVLSDVSVDGGCVVLPLVRIEGFFSLFAAAKDKSRFGIPFSKPHRFSHKIPFYRKTGNERRLYVFESNACVFESASPSVEGLLRQLKDEYHLWCLAGAKKLKALRLLEVGSL
ncbi:hypothetical protein PR202_ga22194 [Eleusine coracana subsp. coracana]|uniref:DUF3444 domain-containing protein n=1 Tax=Eleusine coracana subsp. coracana TaxID=191504 RepID=A0AAV5D3M5_ELECO|nr:hypothetical protein PR202_ga22194 [Eleusine coracana subsp. coracana]